MRKTKFKWAAFLLSAVLCLCTVSCSKDDDGDGGGKKPGGNRGPVAEKFEGLGTERSPYVISTAAELRKLSDDVAGGKSYRGEYFILANDIVINKNVLDENGELSSASSSFEEWIPIGSERTPFCGNFNGDGYTISGIYVNDEEKQHVGLFGYCAGATITYFDLEDSYLKGYYYVGGIVGNANSLENDGYGCDISYCNSYAMIEGTSLCGGCVGQAIFSEMDRCGNFGKVIVNGSVGGGVAGGIYECDVTNCYNHGELYGFEVGGIVGMAGSDGNVLNCFNAGDIHSYTKGYGGGGAGICYIAAGTEISHCINYGTVLCDGELSDAIVSGVQGSTEISYCYYLDTSGTGEYGISLRLANIQSDEFMDEFNDGASHLGINSDRWYIGDNGFPVLASSEK